MAEIYDVETIVNLFTYCSINKDTQQITQFVIHKEKNQLKEFISFLRTVKEMIGFNNCNFDGQIIQFILDNSQNWSNYNGEEIANTIYNYAQYTIETMNGGGFADYPEWKMTIPQIDLFKIWHFDNRAKMTSLKWVEYSIDMISIEEMPIHHTERVNIEQIPNVLSYNMNDVYATQEFYNITIGNTNHVLYKGIDRIQLRKDIKKVTGLNCINFNDVKIGDNINKLAYCKFKGIDKKQIPKPNKEITPFKFSDCFPSYIKFQTIEFNNFIKLIANTPVLLEKTQTFEFVYNGTTYQLAKGGLHSKDKPRYIKPNNNEILRDADIGSMYPNAIRKRKLFPRHLGKEWLMGYTDTITQRLDAKKKYKETKEAKYQAIQEAYKLALNGGSFGKTNEESNWQYDPKVTMDVTIGSQIDLLMLIEDLEIAGIHVLSANTDGILTLINKEQEKDYYKICKDWEVEVGNNDLGQLEYTDYKSFIQTSVNDYIAIKTNDEIKTKGDFVSDFELHKNKSAKIIPIALQKYYKNNIPVEKTIKNHTDIFDFCLGVKSIGKNKLYAMNVKSNIDIPLQKVNRYYISNTGINIVKRLPKLEEKNATNQLDIFGNVDDGTREQEIQAGWLSTIYNKHSPDNINNYHINYNYYIDGTNKIINQIK